MAETPKIRALERGLTVMRAISMTGPLTVSQAAEATSLPRQTVSRILFFLEELGYVERLGTEKRYVISEQSMLLGEGARQRSWLTRIAKPALDSLCREILWPCALAVPRNLEMEIVYDTDAISPLVIRPLPIGLHVPFVSSITGRVFLAHCTEAVRTELMNAIFAHHPDAMDAIDLSEAMLKNQLERIREQGFYCDQMPHKGHCTLAAPVLDAYGVKAVIDMRFPIKALSVAEAETKFAKAVTACAATIGKSLKSETK